MKTIGMFVGCLLTGFLLWAAYHSEEPWETAILGWCAGLLGFIVIKGGKE